LAVADLLVAVVGVPSAIATSVGLLMNSVLMLFCTGSILSLVAVTVDRFWAIVHPLTYTAEMTKRKATTAIAICWTLATAIGLLPVAGWNQGPPEQPRCFFMEVMDFRYLTFIYFATIVAPVLFMAFVYAVIYSAVRRQVMKYFIPQSACYILPPFKGFTSRRSDENAPGCVQLQRHER
jgi:adenosine receptor A2a